MNPTITVLMTVFNAGSYLKDSVNSVLGQEYKDFELLIIDDASTDHALDEIAQIADPRIRIVRNPVNRGQTCSLNIGVQLARGEFIARVDADDLVYPHWLAGQMQFLSQHPAVAVVSCRALVIDENGKKQKVLNSPTTYKDIILKSLFASPLNHVGSLMRKKYIIDVNAYDERYIVAADYALWSALIEAGHELACRNYIGVAIRVHKSSLSALAKSQRRDFQEMLEIINHNIKAFTSFSSDHDVSVKVWRLAYDYEPMNAEEFIQYNQVMARIYQHWKGDFHFSSVYINNFIRKTQQTMFLKKILYCLSTADVKTARECSGHYLRTYGIANMMLFVWFCSWFGGALIPTIYQWCNRLRVNIYKCA